MLKVRKKKLLKILLTLALKVQEDVYVLAEGGVALVDFNIQSVVSILNENISNKVPVPVSNTLTNCTVADCHFHNSFQAGFKCKFIFRPC